MPHRRRIRGNVWTHDGRRPHGWRNDGRHQDGETEWQHHMDDEHQPGDEHFGGFDMGNHSFGYSFQMMEGGNHTCLLSGNKNPLMY